MQDLTITLIQSELHWEDPEANLAMLEEKLWQVEKPTDLVVLPEMFNTGFTMNTSLAEHKNGKTINWMLKQANQLNAVLTGSIIVKENENYYNRLIWAKPDGNALFYDKRHLFRMAEEDQYFSEGRKRLIVDLKGWRIFPLICYDLRFPVWNCNRYTSEGPEFDIMVFVANWPEARINAWQKLLQARAIENISYVAAVNRVGVDGKGIRYNGRSVFLNFKGEVVHEEAEKESIFNITVERKPLESFRKKFPAWLDGDEFEIDL